MKQTEIEKKVVNRLYDVYKKGVLQEECDFTEAMNDIKYIITKCEHKGRKTATEFVEYCEDCKKILYHP